MKQVSGDIWKLARRLHDHIVVPTNQGYRKNGTNVMGRGLAYQARMRWPDLEMDYGQICMEYGPDTPVTLMRPKGSNPRNLILFPVKPLDQAQPWMSWRLPASLVLIERSAMQLRTIAKMLEAGQSGASIYLPHVGCGNGGLSEEQVIPVLEKQLFDTNNIILVARSNQHAP